MERLLDYEGDGRQNTALRRLQEGLKAARVPCSIERPQAFVPRSVLQRLVDENVADFLREELIAESESIPSLVEPISQQAPKLLAILVNVKKEQYMIQFLREEIHDDSLPFIRAPNPQGSGFTLLTKQGQPIQTVKDWDSQSINTFEFKQYRVLSPVFLRGEHYDLDELHILPFIKKDTGPDYKPVAAGGYGEVSQECIHPDHHELEDPSARKEVVVAVKRMFHNADFEPERKVYQDLGTSSHPHLINLLFTYRKGDKCHFVFPWADGTLKDYWEKTGKPILSPWLLIWYLQQMVGLASGLAFFHDFTNPTTGMPRFGRHGDIKAQNILWFQNGNVLKIADLGLASVRGRGSRSNVPPSTVRGSPTYSPPDAERKCLVSRKWDIWSLGCLYLEMMTHLILGCDAIAKFADQRRERSIDIPELFTDAFYSSSYEAVKQSVVLWVDRLKRSPRCSSMMHNVLDLIMSEMIVIEPTKRSSAQEICAKLGIMLERSRIDEGYLLKPNPMSGSMRHKLPGAFPSIDSNALMHSRTPWIAAASKSHSWNC
ncbi:hypothetical protein BDV12DRAFT_188059 [Aspergillus spectabilis]